MSPTVFDSSFIFTQAIYYANCMLNTNQLVFKLQIKLIMSSVLAWEETRECNDGSNFERQVMNLQLRVDLIRFIF